MPKNILVPLYALLALVYLFGMFIPLMENDSAQHASMAMHMVLNGDYLHLYKGLNEYLDKPHMHFWLAALSFNIFGIHDWAYRIPALLFTALGAYSAYGLSKDLYGVRSAHWASLIFLSAQAIILANHDVRTDAVLTGSSMFAIWQLARYIDRQELKNALLGGLGLGIGFSTKGQLAVFTVGAVLFCYILYNRKWKAVLSWKVLAGAVAFLVASAPMLYAYYVQFDSHPEKVVNGHTDVSGIRFIFWDQSFNRMAGTGFDGNRSDRFFFFHTMLWAFLPWSLITYIALFHRSWQFAKDRFKYRPGMEFLTVGGFWLSLTIMNFAKSKLPHYMNSILPVIAVLLAGYLLYISQKEWTKRIRLLLGIQYFIIGLGSLVIITVLLVPFEINYGLLAVSAILLGLTLFSIFNTEISASKVVIVSVLFSVFVNFSLNSQFYPKLLEYQGGITLSRLVAEEKINPEDVFIFEEGYSWSFNVYNQYEAPSLFLEDIPDHSGKWLLVYDKDMERLEDAGVTWDQRFSVPHYRITMLSIPFLNPDTREEVLRKVYLLQLA